MPLDVSKNFDEKVVSTPEKLSLFVKRDMGNGTFLIWMALETLYVVPSMNRSYI